MNCDFGFVACPNEGTLHESNNPRHRNSQRYVCPKHLAILNVHYGPEYQFVPVTKEQEHERFQADMARRRKADPEWDR